MEQTVRACPNCRTTLPANAAYCYVCGTATPTGIDRHTGEYVVLDSGGVAMADLLPRVRTALAQTYELGERIGAGGFAEVFAARDLRLKREVAIKITRPDFALNALMMVRFQREAETIAALRHPNIMPIYDIGEAVGLAYIVMPFVRGESLKARLDREARLPAEKARSILLQVADALSAAHEAGVVHRDVKPDNIMLDRRENQVLLMDFGIAKAIEAGTEGGTGALTSTGLVMGTPHYMSPEQAAGERNVDARADQYALGVIGYRMLAGALPFDGPTVRAILAKQLVGAATPLLTAAPDVPPALAAAVERAMAKEPADRFESVRDFADALRADPAYVEEMLGKTGRGPAYRDSTPAPIPAIGTSLPPSRAPWVVGALAALAVIGGSIALSMRHKTLQDPALTAAILDATAHDSALQDSAARDSAGRVAAAQPAAAPAAAASVAQTRRTDSASGTTVPMAAANSPAVGAPDSVAKRLAADSALVRRAGFKFGTPPADSFLVNWARSKRRSCEDTYAAGRYAEAAAVCDAVARVTARPTVLRTLGLLLERSGRYDSAAVLHERASTRDAEAAMRLARLLDEGRGVVMNPARATALLTEAANQSDVNAQRMLGIRLAAGRNGVPRDERAAFGWFRRAGDGGDVASMDTLGEWFSKGGRGVKKSDDSAVVWWRRAADKGDATGQYWLGRAYSNGHGVEQKSDSVAVTWFRKAAARGHSGALFELQKRHVNP